MDGDDGETCAWSLNEKKLEARVEWRDNTHPDVPVRAVAALLKLSATTCFIQPWL